MAQSIAVLCKTAGDADQAEQIYYVDRRITAASRDDRMLAVTSDLEVQIFARLASSAAAETVLSVLNRHCLEARIGQKCVDRTWLYQMLLECRAALWRLPEQTDLDLSLLVLQDDRAIVLTTGAGVVLLYRQGSVVEAAAGQGQKKYHLSEFTTAAGDIFVLSNDLVQKRLNQAVILDFLRPREAFVLALSRLNQLLQAEFAGEGRALLAVRLINLNKEHPGAELKEQRRQLKKQLKHYRALESPFYRQQESIFIKLSMYRWLKPVLFVSAAFLILFLLVRWIWPQLS